MILCLTKQSLISQVHEVFQNVQPPAIDSGVQISFSNDTERTDLAIFLQGKHWTEVTSESLFKAHGHQHDAILCFLTLEGFHYYYPAFLLISLNAETSDLVDGPTEESIIPFSRYYCDEKDRFYQFRIQRFSVQQLQVIETVLRFIRAKQRNELLEAQGKISDDEMRVDLEEIDNAIKGVLKLLAERS